MDFIPMANPYIGEEEANAVYEQVKSGWISMGPRVKEFERRVAEYLDVRHVVAFNSGTATLHAALIALGIGPGDEVLVPTLSYISSANAVIFCGAKPIFVQEDMRTFNVEAEEYDSLFSEKTKAFMTVDLKGMPVDYDKMLSCAKERDVPIIADSAESFGAKYKGKLVGAQADVHSFSMFANKNITTGEGGFITTNDEKIAEICRCVRNQGQSERYVHVMIGHNYRMTDVIAAFGIEQIKRVEWIMEQKNGIAQKYSEAFAKHPLIHPPYVPEYVARHSWYMYCLVLDDRIDRDSVAQLMKEDGVDHRLSFPPIPLQPIYRELYGYQDGDFPRSEKIFRGFLDIPCWVGMKDADIEKVIYVVTKAVDNSLRGRF